MTASALQSVGLPVPVHDADHAGRVADRILAQRQFQPPKRSLTQRAIEWAFERLGELISALSGGGRGAVVAWIVVLGGVAVLVWVISRAVRGRGRRGSALGPLDDQIGRASEDWVAEAEANAAAGRWRDALRCRYRALVADLAAHGLLDEVPGRTAGEYRDLLAVNLPAARQPFSAITDLFERAWYGHVPVSEADVAQLDQLGRSVLVAA